MKFTLAHGFTQTRRSWAGFAELLAASSTGPATITAVDMPGHGDEADLDTDLWGAADHLVRLGGASTYIGYSMGGRVSLHAALSHPDLVEKLILIGATPGIADADDRAARRSSDEALADRIEAIGVEQFIDEWLRNPLFAGLTESSAQRSDRLRNDPAGLASSLRRAGTGMQEPLWDRLSEITCPVLLIVGADDDKFRAIADQMAGGLPDATIAAIADAGHSVHLEQPAATVATIHDWLALTAHS